MGRGSHVSSQGEQKRKGGEMKNYFYFRKMLTIFLLRRKHFVFGHEKIFPILSIANVFLRL